MSFHLEKYQGDPVIVLSSLKIIVPTGQDLQSSSSPKIYYRSPAGTETNVVATVESPASDGKLSYEFTTEIDEAGEWRFWGEVILSGDTQPTRTGAYIIEFFEPGEA